jgi:hypothetical protein
VLALVAGRTGPGQGCPGLRESRKALPDPVFVGCQQGFNKRLIVRRACPARPIHAFLEEILYNSDAY